MHDSARRPRRASSVFVMVGALVFGLLAAVAPSAEAGSQASEEAQERRQRILEYWTPQRVENAVPKLPVVDVAPAGHKDGHTKGGPPKDGGGDSDDDGSTDTTGDVTGAPWETANDDSNAVGETTGKVFFTMEGRDYVCSGSTVDSEADESLVLTAGHCIHAGDGEPTSWATNWMFIPAYEDGTTNGSNEFGVCGETYGCWTADDLTTTTDWYLHGASNDFSDDAGFAVMDPVSLDGSADLSTVGVQKIDFVEPSDPVYAFGYPAAKKYKGDDLIYCAGTPLTGAPVEGTIGLGCDMTGGSSGGPWLATFDETTESGTAVSVNSYTSRLANNVMFGPIFDTDEEAAFDLARGTSESGAERLSDDPSP